MAVEIGRVINLNRSRAVSLPAKVLEQWAVNPGDRIAIRVCGERLVLERIDLTRLALMRQAEVSA